MNRRQLLLSVIVPVYNTEKHLRRCLDSIINQAYKNLEIIIVNDFSSDNSSLIIKEYIEHDRRIKIINHEENKGSFQARVTGLEAATGDYISFIDSDDRMSTDYYSVLMEEATEADTDMVIADFINECEDGRIYWYDKDPIRLQNFTLEGIQVLETFMKQQGIFYGWHTVWNKIYKKSLCTKCLPYFKRINSHLVMTDDIAFSCVFWSLANKVVNVHDIYYFYLQHKEQSIAYGSFEKFKKSVKDVAVVFDFFKYILHDTNNWDKYQNDYDKFREFYVKIWANNAIKYEQPDAKNLVKELFSVSEFPDAAGKDDDFYSFITEVKILESKLSGLEKIVWGIIFAGRPKFKFMRKVYINTEVKY